MASQGLGLEALAPNGLLGTSPLASYDRSLLKPGVVSVLDTLARLPEAARMKVNSGFRSADQNRKAGGAKRSQHLFGNAVDIDISSLNPAQKKTVLDAALAAGARGIGVYKSGNVLHFDTRKNAAVWGPSPRGKYEGLTKRELSLLPSWAKSSIVSFVKGGGVRRPSVDIPGAALSTPAAAPLPTPRPTTPAPLAAAPLGIVTRGTKLPAPKPQPLKPDRPMPTGAPAVSTVDKMLTGMDAVKVPSVPGSQGKLAAAYADYGRSRMAAPAQPEPLSTSGIPVAPEPVPLSSSGLPEAPSPPEQPRALGMSQPAATERRSLVGAKAIEAVKSGKMEPGTVAVSRSNPDVSYTALGNGVVAKQNAKFNTVSYSYAGPQRSLLGGTRTIDTSRIPAEYGLPAETQFATAQRGLPFPEAPRALGGIPTASSGSRNSLGAMRSISPQAARDISRGRGGLF